MQGCGGGLGGIGGQGCRGCNGGRGCIGGKGCNGGQDWQGCEGGHDKGWHGVMSGLMTAGTMHWPTGMMGPVGVIAVGQHGRGDKVS